MGLVVALGIGGAYIAFIVFMVRWVRGRRQRHAEAVSQSLRAAGMQTSGVGGSTAFWSPASIQLTHEGRSATFTIRPYTRDFDLLSLTIAAKPMPNVLLRREKATDRLGKRLGYNREVQIGDAEFDAVVFIDTVEPDETVRALLAAPEVRAAVIDVLRHDYNVALSPLGLSATRLQGKLASIDTSGVPAMLQDLEVLAARLPALEAAAFVPLHWSRAAQPMFFAFGVLFAGYVLMAIGGALIHPLVELRPLIFALGGIPLWFAAVAALFARLRGGTHSMRIFILASFIMSLSLIPAGGVLLVVINEIADGSPAVTHATHVVSIPKKKSNHNVTFAGWSSTGATVNGDVGSSKRATVRVGDSAELVTHAGLFGWEWVEAVHFVSPSS